MKLRILTPAIEDLAAGRAFYDHQSPGVGDYFFDSLFGEIDSLVLYAGTHPIRFGYHRMLARHFPHSIYYQISNDEVTVYRVIDCRRDPKWIKQHPRLQQWLRVPEHHLHGERRMPGFPPKKRGRALPHHESVLRAFQRERRTGSVVLLDVE